MAFLSTGELLLSGIMRFNGELNDRYLAKVDNNGQQVVSFGYGYGSGRLHPWEDKFYVLNGSLVLRLFGNGLLDLSYLPMSGGTGSAPYVQAQTAGDYHVYPDGRVLVSGRHTLRDSIRGFEGQYNLIWFSNEGYLDTTRTHRQANGVIWEFKELPDGKFICTCSCTQYEGQPVSRLFRIHADGSLDTTFNAGVNWGNIYAYLPLPDGRVYVGGRYKRAAAPNDTLYLARFMPDGSLDPTFNPLNRLSTLPGMTGAPKVLRLYQWMEGRLFVTGVYQGVNGEPRGAICVVDSTGTLTPDMETCMPSAFSYQGSTNAAVVEMLPIPDGSGYYICGTYSGYTDGTTNDPDQRFVSRLLVSELSVGVQEQTPPQATLQLWPNPSNQQTWLAYSLPGHSGPVQLRIRDAQGRLAHTLQASGEEGQVVWDTRSTAPGVYTVELLREGKVERTERLVIQP